MPAHTLTIEFPPTARIPRRIRRDQDFLRYLIASSLQVRGVLTETEARRLTGDSAPAFEEKMKKYGLMPRPEPPSRPQRDQEKEPATGRWARVARYFESDQAGHLDGQSEEAGKLLRDFREGFELR